MSIETLTRDEILNMKIGPELNQLVAERVMGWKYSTPEEYMWFNPTHYIEAAWKVVEKLSKEKTNCSFYLEFHYAFFWAKFGDSEGRAETAPLAICRAALMAVME